MAANNMPLLTGHDLISLSFPSCQKEQNCIIYGLLDKTAQ